MPVSTSGLNFFTLGTRDGHERPFKVTDTAGLGKGKQVELGLREAVGLVQEPAA